ncbi:hypothetical protein GLOTRDRAFT_93879 [Gloeophyllum trabeum ATCC 11539]|uniref:Uncharacterized protein n=1 Tax=Gloeophyllum trabeum (strain ATCC 11539 / FP-39264 / Madison 617) TaxID=670483 RepID=S7Q7C4_GLOTA|nr:uncharacterized protein GLOTRDRAFT_93879 [Gloeophyllum trabeum ATCC 11539]EPQ55432.1 hypothetical protein GLOTRDRAFT_93879 [Gloeophyllum trabeum ATCC 11539]
MSLYLDQSRAYRVTHAKQLKAKAGLAKLIYVGIGISQELKFKGPLGRSLPEFHRIDSARASPAGILMAPIGFPSRARDVQGAMDEHAPRMRMPGREGTLPHIQVRIEHALPRAGATPNTLRLIPWEISKHRLVQTQCDAAPNRAAETVTRACAASTKFAALDIGNILYLHGALRALVSLGTGGRLDGERKHKKDSSVGVVRNLYVVRRIIQEIVIHYRPAQDDEMQTFLAAPIHDFEVVVAYAEKILV